MKRYAADLIHMTSSCHIWKPGCINTQNRHCLPWRRGASRAAALPTLQLRIVAAALGLLLGGKNAEVRTTTGMVSVFRFASLGPIIIGAQLHGNPTYLGPAITFALVDFILPLALAVEIGHRAGTTKPAS